ncbi:MAG: CAP domain-containing protein [Gaiellales bacterium]
MTAAVTTAAPSAHPTQLSELEANLRNEINLVRRENGLRPLLGSKALAGAAESYSRTMLRDGFFSHVSPNGVGFAQRIRQRYSPNGFRRWAVGENLLSSSGPISAKQVVALWMASPAHRANLLSPTFRQMGIGAVHQVAAPGVFGGKSALVVTLDLGTRR